MLEMKLQILQDQIIKVLGTAVRFTSNRVQLPVLANILIRAEKSELKIQATNLETSFSATVGAKIIRDGEITIPAHAFYDIVSNLNTNQQINMSAEKEVLSIKTTGFDSTISGMNASDFPKVPDKLGKDNIDIDSRLVSESIEKIIFSISNDETRPILTGCLFEFTGKNLIIVSTDGFRLSKRTITIDGNKMSGKKIVVPKSVLSEISKGSTGKIGVSIKDSDNQVVFLMDNAVYSSRILSGTFPDYEKVIPKEGKIRIDVSRDDFVKAIKLSSVFARDASNVIKLIVDKKKGLEIESQSQRMGSQKSEVEGRINGEITDNLEIGFNYKYVEDFLSACKSESILVELIDESSPGIFRDPKDNSYLHIIMPLKLN